MRNPRAGRLAQAALFVALAAGLLIASANVAGASFFLIFDRASGRPGTVILVKTGGQGACKVCPRGMPLWFANETISEEVTDPNDPRLVSVGRLIVDEHGNGIGRVTVPDVPNGRYVVVTECKPCSPMSGGRSMLSLGPFPSFEVVGSSPDRVVPIWPWITVGMLGVGLAVAVLVAFFRL